MALKIGLDKKASEEKKRRFFWIFFCVFPLKTLKCFASGGITREFFFPPQKKKDRI